MEHGESRGLSRHMLIMVLCCLIPLAAITAISVFRVTLPQVLSFGLVLLCPLGMGLMMLMGGHGHDHDHGAGASRTISDKNDITAGSGKGGAACH